MWGARQQSGGGVPLTQARWGLATASWSRWAIAPFASWVWASEALKAAGPACPHPRAEGGVGLVGSCSLCAPRADGPHPAAHGHLHQHQGAPGLLLRPLRARWGAGLQRPPHPRAPGRHAGDRAVPGLPAPPLPHLLPRPLPPAPHPWPTVHLSPGFRSSTWGLTSIPATCC